MGFSVPWVWFAALSCLLCLGGEVWCDCTEENMQIQGGNYTLTKNLKVDSVLVYQCPEGYYPYPHFTRLCQRDSSWLPAPKKFRPQRCKMVECPDPNVLENGNVSPSQERYYVGNETIIECYSGYRLRGSFRRVCLSNTKWSGSTPICSRDAGDTCADPGIPPGTSRTGNVFGFSDKVRYSCNANLLLVGSSERVCQENGQWTGEEPECYYRHTYDTPKEVSESFGSAIKGTLTTYENTDNTQEGRRIRISKSGTLNIYIAVDISESVDKTDIGNATLFVKALISKISSFSTTPNYDVLFFSSEVYRISKISDFMHGRETKSSLMTKLDNFEAENRDTGTDLHIVFKTFLHEMALVKEQVKEEAFKEHRHVLILFTDGAYNMGGSPKHTVEQIKNMVYMNHNAELGTKSREDYLDIYVFAMGREILDDDLIPLTAGKDGKHYFRMTEKMENLKETFDQIIDAEEVLGLCGLYNVTTEGKVKEDQRKRFPWSTFITITNDGPTRSCLGSLVTKDFVLTAAHCFIFGDEPEHVDIEINDQKRKVKKIFLHPDYNIKAKEAEGVKEFYDYDVALLQLKDYIDFSFSIRPICIPCTKETSDALRLVGASTCKDQEDLLFKDNLELAFLSKTKSDKVIEEKTVRAKIGDNRAECISHALKAPGITAINPEVAVTDNFLCTGGLLPQVDYIACRGDSGSAVFKDYEYRTIQVALVSWGTTDLCEHETMPRSRENSRDFHINLFKVSPFLKSVLGDQEQNDYAPLTFLGQ